MIIRVRQLPQRFEMYLQFEILFFGVQIGIRRPKLPYMPIERDSITKLRIAVTS